MRVLFVGGTGVISSACTELAAERGIELTILHRGRRTSPVPATVKVVTADNASASVRHAIRQSDYDAVVQWVGFTTGDVERDIALFRDRTRQYVFISSASVYESILERGVGGFGNPRRGFPYYEFGLNRDFRWVVFRSFNPCQ